MMQKLFSIENLIPKLISKASGEGINRYVVGGIIAKNNKVLCLKRSSDDFMPGIYELPSGTVEKESLDSALIREIKEETGLKVNKIIDYLNHFDYKSRSGKNTRQFNFLVSCDLDDPVLLNPKEHEGYAWLNKNEVLRHESITEETKKTIRSYFMRVCSNVTTSELKAAAESEGVVRFVVGVVVSHDSKVLILKRSSHDFMGGIDELPSGTVEDNESIEMALARELKEETGLEIDEIRDYLGYFDYKSKSGKLTRQLNFLAVTKENKIVLSSEHEGYAWMSLSELDRYKLSDETKKIIKNYYGSFDSKPLFHPDPKSPQSENKKRKFEDSISSDTSTKIGVSSPSPKQSCL